MNPSAARTAVTSGRPRVTVPVLSSSTVSMRCAISRASPLLIRMPCSAPRPVPTMMAIGVAKPKAQGQAMIRTATALTMAAANGAKKSQAAKVASAAASTPKVNQPLTTSARRATGAREPCAWLTSSIIRCSTVPRPTWPAW